MNLRTRKLTLGAMMVAIFGVMLLINRQSGGIFNEVFLFLLPIPMVAYAAMYGWKSSMPVFVCMIFISFFCGDYSSFFYAICEAFTGMVYGTCLNKKKDPGKTLLLLMAIQAAVEVISGVVLAGLFGMDLDTQITEMQTMLTEAVSQSMSGQGESGEQMVQAVNAMFSKEFLFRIYVISMIFLGVLQGFIIYELSLIVLRRLRFPVQKPKPVSTFYPAKWTGVVAFGLFALYFATSARPLANDTLQSITQTAGICGYLYLLVFGFVGTQQYFKRALRMPKALAVILPLLLMFILPYILMFVGFSYVSLSLHERIDSIEKSGQGSGSVRRF